MDTINPTWSRGVASRQAHANLPEGTYERELGRDGFNGPSSHMYHPRPPTGWIGFEGPLRPRAFSTAHVEQTTSPIDAVALLSNPFVELRYWRTDSSMDHLVRNADGDWLLFVHQGKAEWFCDYGHLSLHRGDYLLIPRGTMWYLKVDETFEALMIEATQDRFQLPERGLLGSHAFFDPAMLDVPDVDDAFQSQMNSDLWRVIVKRHNTVSTITYPYNPLDALGWTGTLAPVRINVSDLRPIVSHRYHLPPSVHATFVAEQFLVSTFVPRPFETDPGAIKVPFFHNNDDYDEVLFYHEGNFFSRDNINAGTITLHPAGITHGPQPGALKHMLHQPKQGTDEYAVMIDSKEPFSVNCPAAEINGYAESWNGHTSP